MLATAANGRAQDDGTFRLVPRLPLARRAALLRAAAAARPAPRARAPRRGDRHAEPVRGGVRLARAHEGEGDRGAARRLAHGHAPLRLAAAARALAGRGRGRRRSACAAPTRCAPSRRTRPASCASWASSRPREFAAFMDLELFLEPAGAAARASPSALFVGVLELYKNVDGLARAWRLAAPRVPEARLRIVGRGTQRAVDRGARPRPAGADVVDERLTQAEVAAALDEATCLVLPSRSEGLGRVLVESFLRGRPAVRWASAASPTSSTDGVERPARPDRRRAGRRAGASPDRPRARGTPRRGRPESGERWLRARRVRGAARGARDRDDVAVNPRSR